MIVYIKWPKPTTYDAAVVSQTWYYNYNEIPVDPQILSDKLNKFFNVEYFRQGKPREVGEMAVAIFWPKWRKDRKPVKMALQKGIEIKI